MTLSLATLADARAFALHYAERATLALQSGDLPTFHRLNMLSHFWGEAAQTLRGE